MSMYNALFGQNPHADILLGILGLSKGDVGRFRDCYVDELDGEQVIAVYTRNGGGNRECWEDDDNDGCDCPGCVISYCLPDHPNYLRDEDDDFDCTYATIYFSIPEPSLPLLKFLASLQSDDANDPQGRFDRLMDGLRDGDRSDPSVLNAITVGESIFAAIAKARGQQ